MTTVGLRELKARLSAYVRQARAGERVQITDHGQVVAELVPPRNGRKDGLTDRLVALAQAGHATLPTRPNDPSLYPNLSRLSEHLTSAELLAQERGDR